MYPDLPSMFIEEPSALYKHQRVYGPYVHLDEPMILRNGRQVYRRPLSTDVIHQHMNRARTPDIYMRPIVPPPHPLEPTDVPSIAELKEYIDAAKADRNNYGGYRPDGLAQVFISEFNQDMSDDEETETEDENISNNLPQEPIKDYIPSLPALE